MAHFPSGRLSPARLPYPRSAVACPPQLNPLQGLHPRAPPGITPKGLCARDLVGTGHDAPSRAPSAAHSLRAPLPAGGGQEARGRFGSGGGGGRKSCAASCCAANWSGRLRPSQVKCGWGQMCIGTADNHMRRGPYPPFPLPSGGMPTHPLRHTYSAFMASAPQPHPLPPTCTDMSLPSTHAMPL